MGTWSCTSGHARSGRPIPPTDHAHRASTPALRPTEPIASGARASSRSARNWSHSIFASWVLVMPLERTGYEPPRRRSLQTRSRRGVGTAPLSRAFRACHSLLASSVSRNCTWPPASSATGRPFRYNRRLPVSAASRGPGVRMPTRFKGSAPDTEIQASSAGLRRTSRSKPTASERANCSPEKPATKRPPRISPRASSRR